jgi:hypothetical protein
MRTVREEGVSFFDRLAVLCVEKLVVSLVFLQCACVVIAVVAADLSIVEWISCRM